MLSISNKAAFSIINKIRFREKSKALAPIKIRTKPHAVGDVVNSVQLEDKKLDLTPYQQYLHETKSMERPFTGNLWGELSTGFYHCAVCNTRLFSFDQKIEGTSGYASFYDCVEKRVNVLDEQSNFDLVNIFPDPFLEEEIRRHRRCECAQCNAHLGSVFFDGPYPTFIRFSINAPALHFQEM